MRGNYKLDGRPMTVREMRDALAGQVKGKCVGHIAFNNYLMALGKKEYTSEELLPLLPVTIKRGSKNDLTKGGTVYSRDANPHKAAAKKISTEIILDCGKEAWLFCAIIERLILDLDSDLYRSEAVSYIKKGYVVMLLEPVGYEVKRFFEILDKCGVKI